MTQLRRSSGSSDCSRSGSLITVKNIYYLLLYAWDRFDESLMTAIDAEPDTDLFNLLAAVLTRGVDHLLRRGLDRGYHLTADEIAGVRGKLALSTTVKRNLLLRARVACEFDELSHDVPHNQIVKATLRSLLYCQALDPRVRVAVKTAYLRLPGISDISLSKRTFRDVQLHRNIHFYRFLIDVCRLLYEHLIPDEAKGTFRFRDFTRDEERMRPLFERFLYNFYKHEQAAFKVRSRRFSWAGARVTVHTPASSDGPRWSSKWLCTACATKAKTLRDCWRHVSTTVRIVSTKRLPRSLCVPKESFRQITA